MQRDRANSELGRRKIYSDDRISSIEENLETFLFTPWNDNQQLQQIYIITIRNNFELFVINVISKNVYIVYILYIKLFYMKDLINGVYTFINRNFIRMERIDFPK